MNFLYLSLSKSFVLSICSRDPRKTQPWDIFARVRTAKCIAGCNHNHSLEDDYCVPFFKLKFLIPTLRHILYSPKSSNIYQESSFVSSGSGNKSEKYTFLCLFKKRLLFLKVGKYKRILPKVMVSSP